jgi:hypothetical protein
MQPKKLLTLKPMQTKKLSKQKKKQPSNFSGAFQATE